MERYLRELPLLITVCKSLISCPDEDKRQEIIREKHATAIGGHKGVTKTFNRIRQNYFWNNMKTDIQNYIQNCRECTLKKLTRVKTKQPMHITDTPNSAFDKISMDIVGPLPVTPGVNIYILTIQDLLTKYSVAVPLKRTDSLTIADAFLKHFICIYGAPRALLTDQAPAFFTSLMKVLANKFKIKQFRTTAYHPQSNGSIERSHHVLIEYLKMFITNDHDWDNHLTTAMFSYNTSTHESTGYSPFSLIFGRTPRLPSAIPIIEETIDPTYRDYLTDLFDSLQKLRDIARDNLVKSKEKNKFYYDKRINPKNFGIGTYVYLLKEPKRGKFTDQYSGPYRILEILPMNNVKIDFKGKPRVVHMDKLKLSPSAQIIDPG